MFHAHTSRLSFYLEIPFSFLQRLCRLNLQTMAPVLNYRYSGVCVGARLHIRGEHRSSNMHLAMGQPLEPVRGI